MCMRTLRESIREFEEVELEGDVIKWDSDEVLRERVLKSDYKKIYSLDDISKWVDYGIRNGVVKKGSNKEDVEMIIKWIDLLGKGGKNINVN